MKVEGAAALVTGANRGLGAAIAQALLESGAKVYGAARDNASITNRDVIPVLLDVTSADDIANAARTCGDVSIVVNNAASSAAPHRWPPVHGHTTRPGASAPTDRPPRRRHRRVTTGLLPDRTGCRLNQPTATPRD